MTHAADGDAYHTARYEKERYNFTPEQLGFLGSARAAVGVLIQGFLVGAVIGRLGETAALRIGLLTAVVTYAVEWYIASDGIDGIDGSSGGTSWLVYAAVFMPLRALASYITTIGLKSLLTTMPPDSAQGTTLAAIDVVHSATGVLGRYHPLLRGDTGVILPASWRRVRPVDG